MWTRPPGCSAAPPEPSRARPPRRWPGCAVRSARPRAPAWRSRSRAGMSVRQRRARAARLPAGRRRPDMDEAGARALMERLSVTEPPPSLVNVGLARQHGARRLRRRRWGLAGAPLLAAARVAAVVLGAAAITGPGGAGPGAK